MTQLSQPIVFFGTEDFSLYSLKALVTAGFPIVAVVTKPDTARGRGNILTEPAVKTFAVSHGIPVWQPTRLLDIIDDIKQFDTPAGVLVSFGKIIPTAIIELFSPGIINVHPSLLPLYRGPSPIESAIKNRDAKTGVTLMKLAPKMDAGPIYTQVPYALDQTETKPELYDTLGQLGANLLVQKLPAILDGTISPAEQDDSEATYCQLLSKDDSLLDPSTVTPGEAEALIRAHLGFPRTRVTIGEYTVIVTKSHAVMTKNTPLDIECQNGAFLSIDEVVAPSGRTITGDAFLRGYPL
jgi:methionyl-tRNA formyltransferase